jgi:hypothetical protein
MHRIEISQDALHATCRGAGFLSQLRFLWPFPGLLPSKGASRRMGTSV